MEIMNFTGKKQEISAFLIFYRHRSASRVMKMERYGSVTPQVINDVFEKKSPKIVKKFSNPLSTVKVSTRLNLNYFR